MTTAPTLPPSRQPRRGWRARTRAGWIGLGLALLCAWVFTLWPGLDLWVARLPQAADGHFVGNDWGWVLLLYKTIPAIGWLYFVVGAGAQLLRRVRPGAVSPRWGRRLAALMLVSALGSGLLINAGLKEHWGRARPRDVVELAVPDATAASAPDRHFSPALQPTDQCRRNCSFTSGHAASGWVLMAVGLMGPVAVRRRWLAIGLTTGVLASAGRILQGGHFLSDTLFSGLIVWGTGWVVREIWLRVVARRRARRPAI